ncbi:hypothetical protein DPMN_109297 [Dreissena polymorpha]|uniref:Uncharacterized protein n=1 Tax=Dreissena polymorpha TaxID=45954 RepID=A0A9D4KA18_DREPO|nr:hypothetical protein DPMN_109297 [Dreissena polymorpha]
MILSEEKILSVSTLQNQKAFQYKPQSVEVMFSSSPPLDVFDRLVIALPSCI